MKTLRSFVRPALAALLAASLAAPDLALAASHAAPPQLREETTTAVQSRDAEPAPRLAQSGDCYSIGESVAAQNGGTLARATSATQGGQPVCVIVVLVPAKDGQRPRRTEIVVPQD